MAEAALLGVANSVLNQLSSPAFREIYSLWNFGKDLKKLRETIKTIISFLHEAEQRESKELDVKRWLSKLRSVLYDADDMFDTIAYRALHNKAMAGNAFKKEVHLLLFKSKQLAFNFHIAHNVKSIWERLDGFKKDASMFNFAIKPIEVEENTSSLHTEKIHSFVKVEEVIGRDRERDEIIKLLLPEDNKGEDQSLSVISIIGFEGLGKTALAQLVYNDERVQSGFDMCVWACINYLSDLKQVLGTILTSILKHKPHDNSLDQLKEELRKHIDGKKYLLVLDDVRDEDESNWRKLKHLLNCGKNGIKVLVTTRKITVAQCLDAIKPYYELRVLSEVSAWSLFVKVTFEKGELGNDPALLPLGREMVRKTGCAPLALIIVGSMLRCKEKDKKAWLSIVDEELSDDVGNDKIMQVMKVSYNDLPPALKHCFAYCSLFPKDFRFDKDVLVRLWIAQGFIVTHGKKSLEEVGDDCFFHMVERCFFQDVEMYTKKGCPVYTCKMHDVLHDLAITVAGWESKCFLEDEFCGDPLRHVSFYCDPNFLLDCRGKFSRLKMARTLLFNDASVELIAKSLKTFTASFKVLRALRLSSFEFEKLPDSIGGLIHLRYLDLSQNEKLKFLPNSICKLYHLQNLILEGCTNLKTLPSNFGKLASLRHLFLSRCHSLDFVPSGLAALTSLVTLDQLIVHHCYGGLRYLGQLDNLCGVVEIELPVMRWPDCIEDARTSNMSRKHKLNGMKIKWKTSNAGEMEKEEAKAVLEQLEPHKNLQYLKIQGYRADTLSNWFSLLSNLKELVLEDCTLEYLDVSCVRSDSSLLPCLEILEMKGLPNLKGWWRKLGDNAPMSLLPRVSKVVIEDCPNLMESMPLFGGEIENLRLREVNGKLVSKLLSTPNMSCSSECHHYTKLQVLDLHAIKDFKCLLEVSIGHLTALKSLTIQFCDGLSEVSCCGLAYLTSLEELMITGNNNVRLEDKDDEMRVLMNTGLGVMPWKELQRLRTLHVDWQSHLQDGLQYLTSLENLTIRYYEANQVEADNEDMEGRGLSWKLGLERLHSLDINFDGIRCKFPEWIQYLRFLKYLKLCNCEELMSMSWGILANMKLHTLYLSCLRQVSRSVDDSVAEQESQFNSLVKLSIEIVEEENWIHDIPWKLFPSLRTLVLHDIRNLRSLPDGIQHLTSLQWLDISVCSPELAERCKLGTGVDWPLISHIPFTEIRENTSAQTFKQSMDNQEVEVFDEEKDNQEAEVKKETEWSRVGTSSQETPQHLANQTEDTKGKRKIGIQWEDEDQYTAGEQTFEQSMDNQEVEVSDEEKDNQEAEVKKETEWSNVGTSSLANQTDEDLAPKSNVMEQMKDYGSILYLLPGNYEIEKDTLIQLWMAAGKCIKDESMELQGEEHFRFFLDREYLLHSGSNFMTGKDTYRINIRKINEWLDSQNDNGSSYLKWDNEYQKNSRTTTELIQHVSLVCNDIDETVFQTLQKFNKLRTLLFLGNLGHRVKLIPDQLFLGFENLQVLDLSRTQIWELPSSIGHNIHLRYLDLSWTLIKWLPDVICSLVELQTLKLRGCSNLCKLPKQLERLTKLRHLDVDVLHQLETMPRGIGALVNLRTLSAFLVGTVDGCKIDQLEELNKLSGKFCIAKLENVENAKEARHACLYKKEHLEKLELRWTASEVSGTHYNSDAILESLQPSTSLEELQIFCYEGLKFPYWISNPEFHNLFRVVFYRCENVTELPLIEQLPLLKRLELVSMNSVVKIEHGRKLEKDVAFPKLEELEINEMQSLKVWDWKKRNEGDFVSLTQLIISDCPKLQEFDVLPHLSSIRHFEIRECPELQSLSYMKLPDSLEELIVEDCPPIQKCLEQEGVDWYKIKHVPTKSIL